MNVSSPTSVTQPADPAAGVGSSDRYRSGGQSSPRPRPATRDLPSAGRRHVSVEAAVVDQVALDHLALVAQRRRRSRRGRTRVVLHDVPQDRACRRSRPIGLGLTTVSSASRLPRPPARMATFIVTPAVRGLAGPMVGLDGQLWFAIGLNRSPVRPTLGRIATCRRAHARLTVRSTWRQPVHRCARWLPGQPRRDAFATRPRNVGCLAAGPTSAGTTGRLRTPQ